MSQNRNRGKNDHNRSMQHRDNERSPGRERNRNNGGYDNDSFYSSHDRNTTDSDIAISHRNNRS
jgi:hypothetical protein